MSLAKSCLATDRRDGDVVTEVIAAHGLRVGQGRLVVRSGVVGGGSIPERTGAASVHVVARELVRIDVSRGQDGEEVVGRQGAVDVRRAVDVDQVAYDGPDGRELRVVQRQWRDQGEDGRISRAGNDDAFAALAAERPEVDGVPGQKALGAAN